MDEVDGIAVRANWSLKSCGSFLLFNFNFYFSLQTNNSSLITPSRSYSLYITNKGTDEHALVFPSFLFLSKGMYVSFMKENPENINLQQTTVSHNI